MKTMTLAACITASLMFAAGPASAHYQRQDPGAAIAGGLLGLGIGALGAAAAGQQYEAPPPPVCQGEDGSYYAHPDGYGQWSCRLDD
jgi:hypothetical protein